MNRRQGPGKTGPFALGAMRPANGKLRIYIKTSIQTILVA
jgi:hypothetical protein